MLLYNIYQRKKTCNSIAISVKLKPNHLIYLVFLSENGR